MSHSDVRVSFGMNIWKNNADNAHVSKIDWILYRGPVEVLKYKEIDYNVNGTYPSDHYPIYLK